MTRDEKLREIHDELRAFCHAPDCDKNYHCNCPREHINCRPRLNIVTAIVWEAAQTVRHCFMVGVCFNSIGNYHYGRLEQLCSILCQHKETDPQINTAYDLLCRASYSLYDYLHR